MSELRHLFTHHGELIGTFQRSLRFRTPHVRLHAPNSDFSHRILTLLQRFHCVHATVISKLHWGSYRANTWPETEWCHHRYTICYFTSGKYVCKQDLRQQLQNSPSVEQAEKKEEVDRQEGERSSYFAI